MNDVNLPRQSLFVSYAHEDSAFVAELRKFFIPLERRFGFNLLWDDSQIRSGDVWLQQIEQAMTQARFAVLLMSVDFMASDFIQRNELPRLLDRCRAGELTILPMLVGPIDIDISGVKELQFVNPPEVPLASMDPVDQQRWYLQVALRVKGELLKLAEAANDGSAQPRSSSDGADAVATVVDAAVDAPVRQGAPAGSLRADTAEWTANVPPHMAVAEIENQLLRLKRHTRSNGFAVFDCDGYYVQFYYRAELDEESVVVEAQSNAFLTDGRRLGKLQMRHLLEERKFVQADPGENLLMCAPMNSEQDIAELARLTWELLTDVYPSEESSALSIQAQCR